MCSLVMYSIIILRYSYSAHVDLRVHISKHLREELARDTDKWLQVIVLYVI